MTTGATIAGRSEAVPAFAKFGIRAFTTTRAVGTFGVNGDEPVHEVMDRWSALRDELNTPNADRLVNGGVTATAGEAGDAGETKRLGVARLATAKQVHGDTVLEHSGDWNGWLRGDAADGHISLTRGTGLAVSIADCVPVLIAHPSGAVAALHSGWRGTAARIIERGIDRLAAHGIPAGELHVYLGPAICGKCYEVSAAVYRQLTGADPGKPTTVDLRSLIAEHAHARGVVHVTTSPSCTRCDNDRFYSHRGGDSGRQIAVIIADRQ